MFALCGGTLYFCISFFMSLTADETSFLIVFKVSILPFLTSVAASPIVVLEFISPVKDARMKTYIAIAIKKYIM